MTTRRSRRLRENLEAAAYLAPAGLVLLVFWFLPVVMTLAISFFDATALTPLDEMNFVGAAQYARGFQDEQFVQSIWNTANYALYSIPPTLILALFVAMLLNTGVKGRGLFRTAFFLPYVTTWVAIAIVWNYVYHRDVGLANYLLTFIQTNFLGMEPSRINWLGEAKGIWEIALWQHLGVDVRAWGLPGGSHNIATGPSLALFSIVITSIWRDIGYFMVIFLAGLQNIDKSYYEAASIDGASAWQKFRTITFPLLSPVTFFLMIISMIGAFMEFVPMYIMTPNGGPAYSTAPMVFHLYSIGFTGQWELSYAASLAYILTMFILLLTLLQNRLVGRKVEYDN